MEIKCGKCKLFKDTSYFYPSRIVNRKRKYKTYCRPCNIEYCRQYKLKNPNILKEYAKKYRELRNNTRIYKRYGITIEQYNKMLIHQGFVCYICKKPETRIEYRTGQVSKLVIDHCHKTGKVRALLCNRCNTLLGKAEESIELLTKVINFLKEYSPCLAG